MRWGIIVLMLGLACAAQATAPRHGLPHPAPVNDDVLRIAQVSADAERDFILFMVQRPDDQVFFYLSTPLGGLQKAFVSIPSKNVVLPLERAEAELRFREEVLYWKDRSEDR
jgi:hypothetical protein